MAVGTTTALVLGGTALLGAGAQYMSAREQRKAAERAAETQGVAGQQAAAELRGYGDLAIQELQRGAGRADELMSQQYALGRRFEPEAAVGRQALDRLQSELLGEATPLEMDPGYKFRLDEGNKAIERAAAAAGSFGSGGNLKDFGRFSQGLASQEYGAAQARRNQMLSQLMGLQQVGSAATRAQTGLESGVLGARANLASSLGTGMSALQQTQGANIANALTGNAAMQAQYELAQGQTQAGLYAGLGQTAQQMLMMGALMGGGRGGQGPETYRL